MSFVINVNRIRLAKLNLKSQIWKMTLLIRRDHLHFKIQMNVKKSKSIYNFLAVYTKVIINFLFIKHDMEIVYYFFWIQIQILQSVISWKY